MGIRKLLELGGERAFANLRLGGAALLLLGLLVGIAPSTASAQNVFCPSTSPCKIRSVNSPDKCLDIQGASTADTVSLIQFTCLANHPNQTFEARPVANVDGYYELRPSSAPSKCLDVEGVSKQDGARIQQFSCLGGTNQQWFFYPVNGSPGRFYIISRNSGKAMDVPGASHANGAVLTQYFWFWPDISHLNQQWTLE